MSAALRRRVVGGGEQAGTRQRAIFPVVAGETRAGSQCRVACSVIAAHKNVTGVVVGDGTHDLASLAGCVIVTITLPLVRGLVQFAITVAITVKCALTDLYISRALLFAFISVISVYYALSRTAIPSITLAVTVNVISMIITLCILQIPQCRIESEGSYPNHPEIASFVPTTKNRYTGTRSRFILIENGLAAKSERLHKRSLFRFSVIEIGSNSCAIACTEVSDLSKHIRSSKSRILVESLETTCLFTHQTSKRRIPWGHIISHLLDCIILRSCSVPFSILFLSPKRNWIADTRFVTSSHF